MARTEKTFEIDVPVRVAYNQWTQFEEFPRFMEDVHEVKQLDNVHLHWRASIGGKEKEWNAQITEQVPDRFVAWRSLSGAPNAGRVEFESIGPERTRLTLTMEYEPETVAEKVGDWLGVFTRKVDKTVEDFKEFIEQQRQATGGWRGEVHGGRTVEPASSGLTGSASSSSGAGAGTSETTSSEPGKGSKVR